MKFAGLFLLLCGAAASAQNVTVQVGGRVVGTGNVLNFNSADGIIQSCHPDGPARVTCSPAYDSNIVSNRDMLHGTENYCVSHNGSTSYACSLAGGTLLVYKTGLTFVLIVDAPCQSRCTLNIDGIGPIPIRRADGHLDPLGTLVPGEPQWVFYDGQLFRLMGGGGGSRGPSEDRDRDITARRFIAAMETVPYAKTVTLETTAGDVHKTTTNNTVGNAVMNAATPGLPGQHMFVIIANDQISAKTVTFGANLRSAGPLAGSPGKSATVQFISDGTAW